MNKAERIFFWYFLKIIWCCQCRISLCWSLASRQLIPRVIILWKLSWDSTSSSKHLWKPRTILSPFWLRTVTLHPLKTDNMMTNIISSRRGNLKKIFYRVIRFDFGNKIFKTFIKQTAYLNERRLPFTFKK